MPGHGAASLTLTPPAGLPAAAAGRASTINFALAAACGAVLAVVFVIVGPALAHPALGPVDDHQLPLIMRRIGSEGLLPVFMSYVAEPGARFRPGYWAGQFTELSVWGLNAFGWYLDRMLLLTATIVAGAWAYLRLASWPIAVIGGLLVVVGPQAEAWFRLGPQEAYATPLLLLGIGLVLRRRFGWGLALALAAALVKEAFVPAAGLLAVLAWTMGARRSVFITVALVGALTATMALLQATRGDVYDTTRTPRAVLATALWMLPYGLWPFVVAHPARLRLLAFGAAALAAESFLYAGMTEGRYLLPWVVMSAGLFTIGVGSMAPRPARLAAAIAIAFLVVSGAPVPARAEFWAVLATRFQADLATVRATAEAHPGDRLVVTSQGWPDYEYIFALPRFLPDLSLELAPIDRVARNPLQRRLDADLQAMTRVGGNGYAPPRDGACIEIAIEAPRTSCATIVPVRP